MINYTDNRPERCPNNGDPCPAGEQQQKKLSDFYYGPCGQMPYVMFNDSFLLKRKGQNGNADRVVCNSKLFSERGDRNVSRTDLRPTHIPGTGVPTDYHENPCNKTGIAWSGDTESSGRFQEFPKETTALTAEGLCGGNCMVTSVVDDNGNVPPEANDIVTGINRGYYWREYGHKIPVQTDLDFIVWSRPATLPKFKKLHRIIQKPLVPGDEYILDIEDRFPVGPFSGEKAVVFATRTWIGSDNTVLGGAYCFIGSLACVWALLFVVLHLKNPLGGYTPENMKQLEADAFSGGSQAERKGK